MGLVITPPRSPQRALVLFCGMPTSTEVYSRRHDPQLVKITSRARMLSFESDGTMGKASSMPRPGIEPGTFRSSV